MAVIRSILRTLCVHWQAAFIGAIFGFLLGLPIWCIQQRYIENEARKSRTIHWCNSVIDEIEINNKLGVNAQHLRLEGTHTYYLRYLSNSALSTFLIQEPNLDQSVQHLSDSVHSLLEMTITINQFIDQRNPAKITEISGLNIGDISKKLDVDIDTLMNRYRNSSMYLSMELKKHIY